jgi:hypothetical protein
MSYYPSPTGLSEQQTAIARWVLELRRGNGMALPVNRNPPWPIEAERMVIRRIRAVLPSRKAWAALGRLPLERIRPATRGAGADTAELVFHVARDGRYRPNLYMTFAPDYGRIQLSHDGVEMGEAVDFYGPLVTTSGPIELGDFDLSAGEHALGFVVMGKNAESSGSSFGIDCLSAVPLD